MLTWIAINRILWGRENFDSIKGENWQIAYSMKKQIIEIKPRDSLKRCQIISRSPKLAIGNPMSTILHSILAFSIRYARSSAWASHLLHSPIILGFFNGHQFGVMLNHEVNHEGVAN
jgi:hypothetical protein